MIGVVSDAFGWFVAVGLVALMIFLIWAATRTPGPFPPEDS